MPKTPCAMSLTSPRTALEAQVSERLSAALAPSDLGVNNNFFMLGGNSFLGIQESLGARKVRGGSSFAHSFEAPTIAILSAEVAQLRAGRVEQREERATNLRFRSNFRDGQIGSER